MIQQGVSDIAVNPIDAKAIVTAVKKANQANTPVFMQNLITPVDESTVVEYIDYEQYGIRKSARPRVALLAPDEFAGQ